jgi:two-component system, sensor histidine kinase and response regulator
MAEATPQPGGILAVDDTPANLALLTTLLKGKGYRVRAAPSGALALRAAAADPPELVLLDITMPEMDGFEVCRRLKESAALRSIPIIFLSAMSETFDKVKAFSVGGVDYVTKPFQIEELEARIATHLTLRRLQREVEANNARLAQGNALLETKNAELAENHARLQTLEETRKRLTEMIVHDLRSPIMAAQLCATYVREEAGLAGELGEAMDCVVASCEVLSNMTLDMLDTASGEEATLTTHLDRMSVSELFADVATEVRGSLRKTQKRLVLDVASDVPEVVADRELLRRVLVNLLDNTFKYAPSGSEVRLEAALAGSAYAIRLRDRGPGIPPDQRERIFEPRARLDRDAQNHARTSRGLGLAFCRLAVGAHGGSIWVEDNEPGTTFALQLPLVATSPPPAHVR